MKKLLVIALLVTSALFILTSCSETEKSHTFITQSACNFSTEDQAKVNSYLIELHPYFGQSHQYFGLWEDAFNEAFDEFCVECGKIDNAALIAQLPAGGTYIVYLQDSGSGQIVAQSQIWTSEAAE